MAFCVGMEKVRRLRHAVTHYSQGCYIFRVSGEVGAGRCDRRREERTARRSVPTLGTKLVGRPRMFGAPYLYNGASSGRALPFLVFNAPNRRYAREVAAV